MMNYGAVEAYILSMSGAQVGYPFGSDIAVYTFKEDMFALMPVAKVPLQISLKCDPLLAKVLRERYDEVMPGHRLNKKYWITIVLSGQLSDDEIKDLIRHAYLLAAHK